MQSQSGTVHYMQYFAERYKSSDHVHIDTKFIIKAQI